MRSRSHRPVRPPSGPRLQWVVLLLGVFLGISLLKFGTAVIMERHVSWPKDGYEWAIAQWPGAVGHALLAVVALLGASVATRRLGRHPWLLAMPLVWFLWQLLASTSTVDATLTGLTVRHFAACVVCFYLGFFVLSRSESRGGFWALIIVALLLVEAVGFYQHFRGLAETREFLLKNEATHWRDCPPEQVTEMERNGLLTRTPDGYAANPGLLKKTESTRISATLFYPNALAGALLLLLPAALTAVAQTQRLTLGAKRLVGGILGGGAVACLYWSGSKAGWLLALMLAGIALLRSPFDREIKVGVVVGLTALGIAGFTMKYASFFQRGATSVVARFDYWRAALQTAAAKPVFGTGPGTFSRPYERLKREESEMARLTHNDYLQQASDSGWPGFAFYTLAIAGVLTSSGRRILRGADWERFAVWLGVLGWSLQGLVEFGLYLPALAWPAFTLLGWLLADSEENGSTRAAPAVSLVPRA